ncbi:hypothetical protein HK098_001566 [Nowakowskiella sp. JEL0407]|nr:hypothetical protein HK098_001566 [Nowakowskiella sp. JEL0407]
MEEVRSQLEKNAEEKKILYANLLHEQQQKKIERLAGMKHHLLGTKAIPGIYSRDMDPTESTVMLDESEELTEKITPPKLGPLIKIPESKLKNNSNLNSWVERNLKGENWRPHYVKPIEADIPPEKMVKIVQGPFKPLYKLENLRDRPFYPSLRVQTDYYDTREHAKKEKHKKVSLQGLLMTIITSIYIRIYSRTVSSDNFKIVKHVQHPHPDYFSDGDPYSLQSYGRK